MPEGFFADIDPRVYARLINPLDGATAAATPEAFVRNCVLQQRISGFDGVTAVETEVERGVQPARRCRATEGS